MRQLEREPSRTAMPAKGLWLLAAALCPGAVLAQSLNWEGQTGGFITPFAYTANSPAKGIGTPAAAYHYLNAGRVLGNYHQASLTFGALKRVEFGFTRALHTAGRTDGLSPLFHGGFNTFHGKVLVVGENLGKKKYVPAISAGFVARTRIRSVGGVIENRNNSNGDFYLVGTKTVTAVKALPFLLNFGAKSTNASLFGLAGNAPAWRTRLFGAAGMVLKGPARNLVVVGSEFAQQSPRIGGLPAAVLPTTITYFARIVPPVEGSKLNVDFGVAQAAGRIQPGVELEARSQFAMGVSYRF